MPVPRRSKPDSTPLDDFVAQFPARDKALWAKSAAREGLNLSQWVKRNLNRAARRTNEEAPETSAPIN